MSYDVTADVSHVGGMPWHEAPVPPLDHLCWVQTSTWGGPGGMYQLLRCPCGGVADGIDISSAREVGMPPARQQRFWRGRNSRPGGAPPEATPLRRSWLPWRRVRP